jgi:hypothetical protein
MIHARTRRHCPQCESATKVLGGANSAGKPTDRYKAACAGAADIKRNRSCNCAIEQ